MNIRRPTAMDYAMWLTSQAVKVIISPPTCIFHEPVYKVVGRRRKKRMEPLPCLLSDHIEGFYPKLAKAIRDGEGSLQASGIKLSLLSEIGLTMAQIMIQSALEMSYQFDGSEHEHWWEGVEHMEILGVKPKITKIIGFGLATLFHHETGMKEFAECEVDYTYRFSFPPDDLERLVVERQIIRFTPGSDEPQDAFEVI